MCCKIISEKSKEKRRCWADSSGWKYKYLPIFKTFVPPWQRWPIWSTIGSPQQLGNLPGSRNFFFSYRQTWLKVAALVCWIAIVLQKHFHVIFLLIHASLSLELHNPLRTCLYTGYLWQCYHCSHSPLSDRDTWVNSPLYADSLCLRLVQRVTVI